MVRLVILGLVLSFSYINVFLRGKHYLIIIFPKEKCRLWLEVNTFPSNSTLTGRLLHLSTENVRVYSVRNGHQIAYCRADSINYSAQKKIKVFPIIGKF